MNKRVKLLDRVSVMPDNEHAMKLKVGNFYLGKVCRYWNGRNQDI